MKQGKIRAITPFKVSRGHLCRYQSKARMWLPKWLIVIDIISHTVSKLSQTVVQILDTLRFLAPFWALDRRTDGQLSRGYTVRCITCSRTVKNWSILA